jgi:hypothetical protein
MRRGSSHDSYSRAQASTRTLGGQRYGPCANAAICHETGLNLERTRPTTTRSRRGFCRAQRKRRIPCRHFPRRPIHQFHCSIISHRQLATFRTLLPLGSRRDRFCPRCRRARGGILVDSESDTHFIAVADARANRSLLAVPTKGIHDVYRECQSGALERLHFSGCYVTRQQSVADGRRRRTCTLEVPRSGRDI